MTLTPSLRKLALIGHVVSSIAWFGAVAVFLALAVASLTSPDAHLVVATCLAMKLTTWFVIVPFAFVSLLSGVVCSLGTNWGLFRYYWVLLKLLMTVFATVVLLIHTQPINLLADAAARSTAFNADLRGVQLQMTIAAGAALLVLLVVTALSVYKPRGMTRYGWRRLQEQRAPTLGGISSAK